MSAEGVLWILLAVLALVVIALAVVSLALLRRLDDALDEVRELRTVPGTVDDRWRENIMMTGSGTDWSEADAT